MQLRSSVVAGKFGPMSHTPGPWIERDEMLVSESGIIICDPYGPNPQDARLIAAAPDLLAALEEIARAEEDWNSSDTGFSKLQVIADRAIAKATDET
jgi:hypothetical protein